MLYLLLYLGRGYLVGLGHGGEGREGREASLFVQFGGVGRVEQAAKGGECEDSGLGRGRFEWWIGWEVFGFS